MLRKNNCERVEVRTKSASLVLFIIDFFTGKMPTDDVKPMLIPAGAAEVLEKDKIRPNTRNASGYYLFFNLAPGDYRCEVESEYYAAEQEPIIVLSDANADKSTVVKVLPIP